MEWQAILRIGCFAPFDKYEFKDNKKYMIVVKIKGSWKKVLSEYFETENWNNLIDFVEKEYDKKVVYPAYDKVFEAFNLTDFDKVKVVILGQDPYHGEGQAHGLSFSVPKSLSKLPPSLRNIYKEIEADLGVKKDFKNGDLSSWAKQGVFLLNSVLTVEENKPASHKNLGWENFTDKVIEVLSKNRKNLVFLLWGNYAKNKIGLIDKNKHLVLTANHPSPFSAHKGFFGCQHFSKTNEFLKSKNVQEIDWESQEETESEFLI